MTQSPSPSRLFRRFPPFHILIPIPGSRPRKIPLEDANRSELLVPIRLELDIEHHKLRDTFVWNLNGQFSA